MGAAYSQDLRERVMAAVNGGLGVYSAAPLFRVSVSYIYKALGRRRATGDVTAHKSGGGPKPKLAAYDEALRAQVAQKADITLVELQAWLANDHAVSRVEGHDRFRALFRTRDLTDFRPRRWGEK